ncbi:MAG: hypothetical protein K2O24_09330 [Muribaculaceae bacterium]|nr:hypothetical protein [Muribaculaceae bacterium]
MTVVSVAVLALLTVSCSTSRPRVSFVPTRPTVGMSSRLDMIDVSHHNGAIDWNTVSRQVGYAYIKATEGYHFVDDKYAINRDEARRHGVKTGPYHYFRLNHPAREQFENFRKTVGKKLDLVPMIDLEMDNNNRDRYTPGNLYPEETANLLEFLRMVEKEYKVTPVLYVGGDQFYRIFIAPSAELRAYPQWRRSIGDTLKRDFGPEDNVVIWQYNGAGRLDGIDHDVDMNMILDPGSVVKK